MPNVDEILESLRGKTDDEIKRRLIDLARAEREKQRKEAAKLAAELAAKRQAQPEKGSKARRNNGKCSP